MDFPLCPYCADAGREGRVRVLTAGTSKDESAMELRKCLNPLCNYKERGRQLRPLAEMLTEVWKKQRRELDTPGVYEGTEDFGS